VLTGWRTWTWIIEASREPEAIDRIGPRRHFAVMGGIGSPWIKRVILARQGRSPREDGRRGVLVPLEPA
jgi:hypothetical protein